MENWPWIALAFILAIGIPTALALWVVVMSKPKTSSCEPVAAEEHIDLVEAVVNYSPSKYASNQLLSVVIATLGAQFMALAAGLWWLFPVGTFALHRTLKQQELIRFQAALRKTITLSQVAALMIGGAFYFVEDYRPVIVLVWMAFFFIYPSRAILGINKTINAERRSRAANVA